MCGAVRVLACVIVTDNQVNVTLYLGPRRVFVCLVLVHTCIHGPPTSSCLPVACMWIYVLQYHSRFLLCSLADREAGAYRTSRYYQFNPSRRYELSAGGKYATEEVEDYYRDEDPVRYSTARTREASMLPLHARDREHRGYYGDYKRAGYGTENGPIVSETEFEVSQWTLQPLSLNLTVQWTCTQCHYFCDSDTF